MPTEKISMLTDDDRQEDIGARIRQDLWNPIQRFIHLMTKSAPLLILVVIIYLIYKGFVFHTESGFLYHYENMINGEIQVYQQPGTYFKIPLATNVTRYYQVWTVNFGSRFTGKQILEKGAIQLRFADNYTAKIPAIFRYKLSLNPGKTKMIHREFTNFYNLIDSLLIPISRSVMVSTATQYTGEEFFQGGLNSFRVQLLDQLQYGLYVTEPQVQKIEQLDGIPQRTSTLKIWKPVKDAEGKIKRMDNPLDVYGIEVTQVELGVPVPEQELNQLLVDEKRFDRLANEKANERALVLEEQDIQLAHIEKDKQMQLANIQKEKETQLANIEKMTETDKANKVKELVIVEEEKRIQLAQKARELALLQKQFDIVQANNDIEKAEEEKRLAIAVAIAKAKKEEELALALATIKARKAEELVVAKANEKIQLTKKAEELAIVKEEEKIKLAQIEQEKNMQLAQKAKELTLVQDEQKIELAKKAEELALVQEEQKIRLAQVEADQKVQLANKARKLVIVTEEQKVQLAHKAQELALVEADKNIQVANQAKELAIAKANREIQQANLEAAQFEANVIREKGIAEAEILKAKYEARISEMYLAELKKEIALIMYPNLKGITVTMPHNVVNLGGDKAHNLPSNLDVLSSFATIGVMEKLEKQATETQPPTE
jgi:hypothetical protein